MREDPIYKNRDWMHEHYQIQEESTYAMALEARCSYETIRYWLYKLNIPVRSNGEGIFLAKRNHLTISRKLLDLVEGELLGDGYVGMSSRRSAHYTHASKYEEYVAWLSQEFVRLGMEQSGKICPYQNKRYYNWAYYYESKSYPELVPIRERWYPDGEKIVPKDLRLNPLMSRQWYIGDGGLEHSKRKGKRPWIILYTCAFDKASIDYLIKELTKQGFKATHQPANNVITISTYSTQDFLNWIGPSPIQCYNYKWNYEPSVK